MADEGMVVGLVCSPHSSGNTAILVLEVLSGAESVGRRTKLVCLGDVEMGPLIPSDSGPYGVTSPQDELEEVFELFDQTTGFVLGSPIYFDNVSSRTKILVDRMIRYSEREKRSRFPRGIPAVLAITYEWDNPSAYDKVMDWMCHVFEHYFKMNIISKITAEGTSKRPVDQRDDLLELAFEAGRRL